MILSCSNMNSFEKKGLWWLPETPDLQVAGYLRFSHHEGILLEIIGVLKPRGKGADQFHQIELVNGITTDGKLITLINCFRRNYSSSSVGIEHSKYISAFAYEGIHLSVLKILCK